MSPLHGHSETTLRIMSVVVVIFCQYEVVLGDVTVIAMNGGGSDYAPPR